MRLTEQKIKVMQAYLDGKEIEYAKENEKWISANIKDSHKISWNWENYDYRIKKREFWIVLAEGKSYFSAFENKLKAEIVMSKIVSIGNIEIVHVKEVE